MDWKFNDEKNRVVLDKAPTRPKKITAGRLGTILGLNDWQTPFYGWCDMTKVYVEPFEDTKYTIAGKVIEPIIINYLKGIFGEKYVLSPEEYFKTSDAKKFTGYDFYKGFKIFGGMWDAVIINPKGEIIAIIEIKTSSRPQDWLDGVPSEKKVQGLLYGHLSKVPTTYLVGAFLDDNDYVMPENFVPNENNTKIYPFKTEEALIEYNNENYTISDLTDFAEQWYNAYIKTGISPEFDNVKDKTILSELRKIRPDEDENSDLSDILKAIAQKELKIEEIRKENGLDDLENDLKNLKDGLKRILTDAMGEDDTKAEVGNFILTKTVRQGVDTARLKADGIYENYLKESVSYTLKERK